MPWIKHGPDHMCLKPKIVSDWLFWASYHASEGDVWECDECGLRYTVLYNGFTGLYWSQGRATRMPARGPKSPGLAPPPARKGQIL